MRISSIMIFVLFAFKLGAQDVKKNQRLSLYALAIDARILQGDSRLPQSIVVNNHVWNELREQQPLSRSTKLDSMLKSADWRFLTNKNVEELMATSIVIKSKKILPYLKHRATLCYNKNWFLEASPLVFSERLDKAVMILRMSSTSEILDLCFYFFEKKNNQWILIKEIAPGLI